jgi:sorbose reductase
MGLGNLSGLLRCSHCEHPIRSVYIADLKPMYPGIVPISAHVTFNKTVCLAVTVYVVTDNQASHPDSLPTYRNHHPVMASANQPDLSEVRVTDRFDLSNRNFLITGGGRGIGFACAKAIAQLGGGVAVIDALPEPTEEFHSLSKRYGVKTSYAQGDVTKQQSLEAAFAKSVEGVGGHLHGGLMAAGICVDQPLLEATWEVSQKTFDVNVMGLYWTVKLLAQHLVETKTPGSIVTIASLNGQGVYVPAQPCSSYNASKAAVKGMVGPLAGELGQYGIRVNSISPGRDSQVSHRNVARLTKDRCHSNTATQAVGSITRETSHSRLLQIWRSSATAWHS